MFDKVLGLIKSNKISLFIVLVVIIVIGYIVIRILGIFFAVAISAFFVSMYRANEKRKYIAALKIMGGIVVIGGALLFLLLMNHEWPLH